MSKLHELTFFTAFFIAIVLFSPNTLSAQEYYYKDGKYYKSVVVDKDTMMQDSLPTVTIIVHKKRNFFSRLRHRRLIKNLKIVYPYAKLAGEKLSEFNDIYLKLESENEKKHYAKEVEKELLKEHEDELRKLTVSQGKLLVLLLHRETGKTSYEILQEFRGDFSAFFWQTLSRIFGYNLKSEYHPEEEKELELLIEMLENGRL